MKKERPNFSITLLGAILCAIGFIVFAFMTFSPYGEHAEAIIGMVISAVGIPICLCLYKNNKL